MKHKTFLVAILILGASSARAADQINALLDAAATNSERLASSRSSEKLVELRKVLAETADLPSVAAEAIDSTGFGGSTGLLGVGGIMGSPYRSGYGYGLVATQTIFDFGQTSHAKDAAEAEIETSKADVQVVRDDVLRGAVDAYVQCALAESERENWASINQETATLAREISKFVRTGQKSIVEDALARGQQDEASRTEATFDKRIVFLKQRLAVITGWAADKIECGAIEGAVVPSVSTAAKAAIVARAEASLHAANEELRSARSGYLPKLVGLASVGDVEDTRVVQKTDYALGVGLTIPLFDSGRTNVEVDRAKANIEKSTHDLKAAQQALDESNARYDEAIQAAQTELDLLKQDLGDAEKAFSQAKKRYQAMSGSLVDLRESVRNLSRVRAELSENRAQLVRTSWQKAILNGIR